MGERESLVARLRGRIHSAASIYDLDNRVAAITKLIEETAAVTALESAAVEVREAAAKVAEAAHSSWDASEQELTDYGKSVRRICQGIATAIRKLPVGERP